MLAMDTSTDYLSLALMRDEKVMARFHRKSHMRHSSLLVPMVDKLLKKAQTKLKDISCLAISIGPGSFTGLRIGVSTVKALAAIDKKKVAAVPSLDVIAHNIAHTADTVCVVVDAKKEKLYSCFYEYKNNLLTDTAKPLLTNYSYSHKNTNIISLF